MGLNALNLLYSVHNLFLPFPRHVEIDEKDFITIHPSFLSYIWLFTCEHMILSIHLI